MKKNIVAIVLYLVFFSFIGIGIFIMPTDNQDNENYDVHRSCLTAEKVKGIDVSYYQGNIDWKVVKDNDVEFAFARASDGLIKEDPKFVQNWNDMLDAGVLRGAYQFYRPSQDPIEQAQFFTNIVEQAGGFAYEDLPSVIDVEVTGGSNGKRISKDVLTWLKYIEAYTHKRPIIYSGPYFWELNKLSDEFSEYPLWTAHYTKQGDECPLIPDPWDHWTFWQYTGSGNVVGVKNIVDINVYNGTFDDLLNFVENSRRVVYKDAAPPIKDVIVEPVIKNAEIDVEEETGAECTVDKETENKNPMDPMGRFAIIAFVIAIATIISLGIMRYSRL